MSQRIGIVVSSMALLVAGCAAVNRARQAQDEVGGLADGNGAVAAAFTAPGASLSDMVAYAISNRPSMASARLAVDDARLALKEIAANAPLASKTPWNAFGADASVGYSAASDSTHLGDMRAKTSGSWSGSLSLDILVWDFGRNDANVRAQGERVVAAELELAKAGYDVFGEVSSAYFSRLQNAALLEVALTNEHMYAEHLARAKERFETGEAQRLDVLRATLDLAEARETVVAASNDFTTAGAKLASALGLDADFADAMPAAGAPLGRTLRVFADTSAGTEELFAFSRTNAPAMQVRRARLRTASAAVDFAVADLGPSVSASLSFNWADPLWYWRWGASAAQSLFTGFRRTAALDRATVALRSAATEVEAAELELSLALELAVAERDNAREALESAEASVASAKENFCTVAEQFSLGDVSRVEFTDAVADYSRALANRVKAFYRGQAAEAALFALQGLEPAYEDGLAEEGGSPKDETGEGS